MKPGLILAASCVLVLLLSFWAATFWPDRLDLIGVGALVGIGAASAWWEGARRK